LAPRHEKETRGAQCLRVSIRLRGPEAPSSPAGSGQRIHVACEPTLNPCHPIRVKESASGRSVQESNRITKEGRPRLDGIGCSYAFDSGTDASALSPVLKPRCSTQDHPLLGTLNIRHCFALGAVFRQLVSKEN
jgi:hypothetical protein